ncbi:sulfotransferase (plasmid) [Leisingera caerulea]|uniref:Sulfotransferase n=1 Tax=Leisingera caerulea TaxID=506591 RepID=A0A9Q9HK20_LEICA|nr:sulfotransferase [Leisingera caerulea]UWQ56504.1 sulfotransferase [Leisingera caerulea]UWQ61064.1 sulfotransferase [Leisingera caerulea]UWQ64745.1 sulfotransferase [Leisingera caerulea]
MKKPAYSPQAAAAEARKTAQEIHSLLQEGRFSQARTALENLGKSDLQVKRRRVRTQPAEDVRIKRPVFICGLHRSGTTLLHDYLCAHYSVSFFQSAKVPENEGQFLQDVYMAERPFGGPGAFAFYPQMEFAPLKKPERARKTASRLLAQWDSWVSGESPVLLEKSPPNIIRIPYFRSLFPEARFIVWTRDPRAVSLSTRKWHKLPVPQLMAHWNTAYMKAFQDLGEDCILARYEDFCAAPASTAERIAAFCGLEKRPAPLPLAERFSEVKNSNAKYTAEFPATYQTRNLVRAWEYFGYSLSNDTGTASND